MFFISDFTTRYLVSLNIVQIETDNTLERGWEVFCKKIILKNLARLTGKHLCQSLFFNKVAG